MPTNQISVDTQQLDNTAAHVESILATYRANVTKLFELIGALKLSWAGSDNIAYATQIESFQIDYQNMENLLRDYADFLRHSSRAYRETQENIRDSAQALSRGYW
jgi:WXG100 family type VII secretion target